MAIAQRAEPAPGALAKPEHRSRWRWLPDAAGLVVIGGILLAFWLEFGKLFPLVEFNFWIVPRFPLSTEIGDRLSDVLTFANVYHTRTIPLFWSSVAGHACGTNVSCVNAVVYLPVVLASVGLFAVARVFRLPASVATAVVAVFLVSEPNYAVNAWQATQHDRWAALATVACLLAFFFAARYVRRTWWSLLGWTVGLTILGLAAMNTKEAAWIVLPLAVTTPLLVARDRRQAINTALVLAIPVIVMAIDAITQYVIADRDPHVNGGSIGDNLRTLTTYAVPGGLAVAVVLLVLCAAAAGYVLHERCRAPDAVVTLRLAAWLWIAVAIGWAIPIRTQIASAFYMYVPLATAALAVALTLRAGYLALPRHRTAPYRYAAAAVTAGLCAWFVGGVLTNRIDQYTQVAQVNTTWRQGLPRIGEIRAQHPNDRIAFATPQDIPNAYQFTTSGIATDLFRFTGDQQPVDQLYGTAAGTACGTPGTVVIKLNNRMQATGTC